MYSKLWSKKLSNYENEAGVDYINTKKMNLIIGPNNSGKSRFIRFLFDSKEEEIKLRRADLNLSDEFIPVIDLFKSAARVGGLVVSNFLAAIRSDVAFIGELNEVFSQYKNLIAQAKNSSFDIQSHTEDGAAFRRFRSAILSGGAQLPYVGSEEFPRFSLPKRVYIPILRGMRPLVSGGDVFSDRTKKDYFPNIDNSKCLISTGFDLYGLLSKYLLGEPSEREKIRIYEKIIGQEFFGGSEVTLIPKYNEDTVAVKIGGDDQFSISNLGDGLQQVIIITSAAFLAAEDCIFFIEEPENCLHPGMLKKLAIFLLEHTGHQYFITTHSNHILDLAELREDITVHRLTKSASETGRFSVKECTKDRQILLDLGVKASSVYLANCSIWVEGITDRLYFREFMRNYIDRQSDIEKKVLLGFLENYHYAFIEYQGGNLIHWNFDSDDIDGGEVDGLCAIRSCPEILLIADGDIKSKGDRWANLSSQLGSRAILIAGKETENLLPLTIISGTVRRIYSRMRRSSQEKADIELISNLTEGAYRESPKGIGYHIDRALRLSVAVGSEGLFKDDSGTIKDKVKFCNEAVKVMRESAWVNCSEADEICSKIFEHIKVANL